MKVLLTSVRFVRSTCKSTPVLVESGTGTEPVLLSRVASYEVEIQKKLALPAACLALALAGMALAFRMPRGFHGLLNSLVASLRFGRISDPPDDEIFVNQWDLSPFSAEGQSQDATTAVCEFSVRDIERWLLVARR